MKKLAVRQLGHGTPEYVIAHAALRMKRGKRPSAMFDGVANPMHALQLAYAVLLNVRLARLDQPISFILDPLDYVQPNLFQVKVQSWQFDGLPDFRREIQQLLAPLPNVPGAFDAITIQFEFKGVWYRVQAATTLDELRRQDPSYKLGYPEEVNALVRELDSLDFTDIRAVVEWLMRIALPSETVGVGVPAAEILRIFQQHGFTPQGGKWRLADHQGKGLILIGQALTYLRNYGMMRAYLFEHFARQWLEEGEAAASV